MKVIKYAYFRIQIRATKHCDSYVRVIERSTLLMLALLASTEAAPASSINHQSVFRKCPQPPIPYPSAPSNLWCVAWCGVVFCRLAVQWKEEIWVWVDKYSIHAQYQTAQNPEAHEFVEAILKTAKQKKDHGLIKWARRESL